MPWLSTATYQAGESITLGVELKSHHLGHMGVRGCPVAANDATDGRASVTQDCFDAHVLEFIEDVSYQMPKGTLLRSKKERKRDCATGWIICYLLFCYFYFS